MHLLGRIQDIEFERHGIPLPLCCMGKPSLATTTDVDACLYPSFNYDDKGTSDVGLACRCHLGNILPDSIFND